MNFVKLTRITEKGERWEEAVNLDHVRTMSDTGEGALIAFGDPGLETTAGRYYAESPNEIMRLLYVAGWRS